MPACGASGQGDDTPAQYPYLLNPGLTIASTAATASVLEATLISMAVGALILVPSLLWLYILFQRTPHATGDEPRGATPTAQEVS